MRWKLVNFSPIEIDTSMAKQGSIVVDLCEKLTKFSTSIHINQQYRLGRISVTKEDLNTF